MSESALPAPDQAASPNTWGVIRRMVRDYLGPAWRLATLALVANIVVAASTGALPWLIQQVFDKVLNSKHEDMLIFVSLGAVIISAIKGAASYTANVSMIMIGQRIMSRIQIRMFTRIIEADLAWVTRTHSGRFLSSFMTDAARVRDAITITVINLTQNLLTVIALVAAMYYLNWRLALLGTAILPFGAFYMRKLGRKTRKAARKGLEGTGDLSAIISEALGGIRVLKAYGQEHREIGKATEVIQRVIHHTLRGAKARAATSPLTEALSGIGIGAVIYFGGRSVIGNSLTTGELMGFLSAMMLAYQPLKAVANTQTFMQEGVAAAIRLFPILDIEPRVFTLPDARPLALTHGAITFDNVTFAYEDGTAALNGINIEVPKGHTVALVGPSGGGKSTMLNLVPRFYDPTSGKVSIDGQDVRHVTIESLRRASSLVTQEPFLFDDTVRANIAYGRPDASEADIEQAARNAAAHDFILALPNGYETSVGEAGFKLSGGQRQRIAIARAMLKNAPILLLDEATSALDTASEALVQTALAALMQGRTTLVIAHRLSTIRHANRIYVIDKGTVIEQGTHSELVEKGGLYAELSRSQFVDDEIPVDSDDAVKTAAIGE